MSDVTDTKTTIEQLTERPTRPCHDVRGCIDYLLRSFTTTSHEDDTQPCDDLNLAEVEKQLSRLVAQVRYRQNTTLPVMRLPAEVFETIFGILQDVTMFKPSLCYGSWGEDIDTGDPHQWLRIRLVCRYWHDVAASRASQWSTIILRARGAYDQTSPGLLNYTRLHLRNSGQSPLAIHVYNLDWTPNHEQALLEALSHLSRIRELRVLSFSSLSSQVQELLANTSARSLETLVIQDSSKRLGEDRRQKVLPPLFNCETPTLRSLAIHRFTDYGNSFRNLKQLHLIDIPYLVEDELTSFLDLLDANPTLEDLMFSPKYTLDGDSYENNCCTQERPTSNITRCSHLPNLRRLSFRDVSEAYAKCILSHLHLDAGVALSCRGFSPLVSFYPTDHSYLQNFQDIERCLLSFGDYNDNGRCIMQAAGAHSAVATDCSIGRTAVDSLTLCATQFWSCTKELWIEDQGVRSWGYFRFYDRILRAAPAVEKIVLNWGHQHNSLHWLTAMCGASSELHSIGRDDIPCPLLRELHILGPLDGALEAVKETLEVRAAHGLPRLEALHVYLPLTGFEDDVLSVCREVFAKWTASAPTIFHHLVKDLVFVRMEQLPCMDLPPICNNGSSGRWQWPPWKTCGLSPAHRKTVIGKYAAYR
ncbi:hypothetical protein NM688_g359 [Phlebia brevispora]|uniref:Uncharacterized protein n=1 Tax=Phlebia brevispora TaxID=194682 RepID=A0ACC1TEG0_9APHY|nr:hypothetical protein NM688_g359 [Phlebia brevispora]